MMVVGSIWFCVFSFLFPVTGKSCGPLPVEVLNEQHSHERRERKSASISVFASLPNNAGGKRNTCAFGAFVRWDFGMGHI